ncbi:methylisocitrate lyase [Nitrosococcus oceani ATCC 19707]|uniref:2-methylisocitrate lyase n=2 Tax=Nitrosococcus oceani TaxID=1229 RepID=Q3J927_NITOC|nr:methylisocitrate lyase [Nitrosococcus oceani]ABA58669.1 methylisocitrate lyase [Nitrosococcus oceani ATCC 19707]EDZ68038.1 methylisocitrate lyase [Nitrosococcus oceani AFC27]KFI18970.1 2-methylisocitrate lyase [Nitrosococcus oceani C-27]GEM19790.1 methylisocitrate lyase [Nitrosococcus oceani]
MTENHSPGVRLRAAAAAERPLQVAGVINAYAALLAKRAGFRALYLSGAGVANASFGLPDLGLTTLTQVAEEVRRIVAVTDLPLLVDGDTGWGDGLMVAHTVETLSRAGAAGLHLEDQEQGKRCGHRPGKTLVSTGEMMARIAAAVRGRVDDQFVIMARTDAYAVEGLEAAMARARCYVEAGADMIFAESLGSLEEYRCFAQAVQAPVLANMTEFGQTPLLTVQELGEAGVRLVLYPLSAFRAMSAAALQVYETLRREGTQQRLIEGMQTREELYEILGYHEYERQRDGASAKGE